MTFFPNDGSLPPASHAEVRHAVRDLYDEIGLSGPQCVWFGSPHAFNPPQASRLSREEDRRLSVYFFKRVRTDIEAVRPLGHPILRHTSWVMGPDVGLTAARIVEGGSWWFVPYREVCCLFERPRTVEWDHAPDGWVIQEGGRRVVLPRFMLHNETGAAVVWRDGSEDFFIDGVRVPKHFCTQPDAITCNEIRSYTNAEVARIAVAIYGEEKYVRDSGMQCVAKDECGELFMLDLFGERDPSFGVRRDVCFVRVINSTVNPDGSRDVYFLRVPPSMKTPREAVAWTFGLAADQYTPLRQT